MVCKPEYCEMDVWKMIIASFKAASTGMVTVLGAVDAPDTTTSEYDTLGTAGVGHTAAGSTGAPVDGFSRLLIEGGEYVGRLGTPRLTFWNTPIVGRLEEKPFWTSVRVGREF